MRCEAVSHRLVHRPIKALDAYGDLPKLLCQRSDAPTSPHHSIIPKKLPEFLLKSGHAFCYNMRVQRYR